MTKDEYNQMIDRIAREARFGAGPHRKKPGEPIHECAACGVLDWMTDKPLCKPVLYGAKNV